MRYPEFKHGVNHDTIYQPDTSSRIRRQFEGFDDMPSGSKIRILKLQIDRRDMDRRCEGRESPDDSCDGR